MPDFTKNEKTKHREYLFALSAVEGIGAVRIKRLIKRFGSVERIFEAEIFEIAQLPQFNPILATRILTASKQFDEYQQKLAALADQGIEVIFQEDKTYPSLLKTVKDAPIVLCRIGELSEVNDKCIAIVGSSQPTSESINVTLDLAIRLVDAGFTIVSGLANGIDTNAHYGTLCANGTTIAVLATDVSTIYPSANQELAKLICETGCLFSEHPFSTSPTPANLVMRNRIISGISMATVVIETTKDGGAMHAARYAQLQDRHVFACQWKSQNRQSDGNQQLNAMGAIPFQPNQLDTVVDLLTQPDQLKSHIIGSSVEQIGLFEQQ